MSEYTSHQGSFGEERFGLSAPAGIPSPLPLPVLLSEQNCEEARYCDDSFGFEGWASFDGVGAGLGLGLGDICVG